MIIKAIGHDVITTPCPILFGEGNLCVIMK